MTERNIYSTELNSLEQHYQHLVTDGLKQVASGSYGSADKLKYDVEKTIRRMQFLRRKLGVHYDSKGDWLTEISMRGRRP